MGADFRGFYGTKPYKDMPLVCRLDRRRPRPGRQQTRRGLRLTTFSHCRPEELHRAADALQAALRKADRGSNSRRPF